MASIKFKRGTRAQLNAAASANQLVQGEPYLITDESRTAIGLSASTYKAFPDATGAFTSAFNATTDWGAASGGYYSLAFTHNLNSAALNITLWDTTGAHPVQVFPEVMEATSVNVVTIKVPSAPDKRFAGIIVVGNPTSTIGSAGDVTGPASSSDGEVVVFSGTGGKTIKGATSPVILSAIKPAADSTTALRVMKADGVTPVIDIDTTNSRVRIGGADDPVVTLVVNTMGGSSTLLNNSFSAGTATDSAQLILTRSNSNTETLVTTVDGQRFGQITFQGVNYAATPARAAGAAIRVFQNGNMSAADTVPPADMVFYTSPGGSTVATEGMRLNKNGVFMPKQVPTASAPPYILGGMYFDTTLNKLRIGGATGWETVTSV